MSTTIERVYPIGITPAEVQAMIDLSLADFDPGVSAALASHMANVANPHAVTKSQVGLANVPNVDATARANHTGSQAISTITSLQTTLDAKATAADYFRWHVRRYGAVQDGTTNDLAAVTSCLTAYLAAGCVGRIVFDGALAISGSITVNQATVTGFSFVGEGMGSVLVQLLTNTPHFSLNGSDLHSLQIGNFRATWSQATTTGHTAAAVIHLGAGSGNKSLYNSLLFNIVADNGYRFIDTAGMLFWGNMMSRINLSNMKGGVWLLNGTAGQPINTVIGLYINAQQCTTTLFAGNALVATMISPEINQVTQGVQIMSDNGGGDYTVLGEFSIEGGAWGTNVELFYMPDSQLRIQKLKIETGTTPGNGVTARVRIFVTLNSGTITCDELWCGLLPSGSGNVYFWHVGETGTSDIQDPHKYLNNGRVVIGKVRFYGTLADGSGIDGYSRTTNYVAPTDMGSTAGADAGVILEWMDDSRIDYGGDADYTCDIGGARRIIYRSAMTGARSVLLPHPDFMFGGMSYLISKTVTGQDLAIKNSAGTVTYATIPSANKGWVEVTFNRSIGDGPSIVWEVSRSGTWT